MSATVTIRIDPKLKEKMKKLDHINWSEVIRKAIIETIERAEERNLAEAVLINERLRRRAPNGWDSAKVIKEWRKRR